MVVAMVHGAQAVVVAVTVVVVVVVVNGLRTTQRRARIPNIPALAYRNGNQSIQQLTKNSMDYSQYLTRNQ